MHAKPGLRVVLKWKIASSGSVIADVIWLMANSKTITDDPRVARYADTLSIGDSIVTVSFDGASEFGHTHKPDSNFTVARSDVVSKTCWLRKFGNIPIPDGPWHGYQLIIHVDDRLFVGVDRAALELDPETGQTLRTTNINNTVIRSMLLNTVFNTIVVRTDYYGFDANFAASNISAINLDGSIAWSAQLPNDGDVFTNCCYNNGILTAYSWNGWDCQLDDTNGVISEKRWTK